MSRKIALCLTTLLLLLFLRHASAQDRITVSDISIAGESILSSSTQDDSQLREGTLWNSAEAHILPNRNTSLILETSELQEVKALLVQADNNDAYIVEGSSDKQNWEHLWTVPPILTKEGLVTRSHIFEPEVKTDYKYYRIRPGLGDGSFSISRFILYKNIPPNWPLVTHDQSPFETMKNFALHYGKQILALIGLVLFAYLSALKLSNISTPSWLRYSVLAIGLLSVAFWWELFTFHSGRYIHKWDFGHYYIGGKYFPELGYEKLYLCLTVADQEDGHDALLSGQSVRDLETNKLVPSKTLLLKKSQCKEDFSAERWQAFKRDADFFRNSMNPNRWQDFKRDHGFNAPPGWTALARPLTKMLPLNDTTLLILGHIDTGLIVLMWAALYYYFGIEAASLAALFWGTNYPARFFWNGGSLLRYDWLAYLAFAACSLRANRYMLGGFLFGISTQLRIFPGVILLGVLIKLVYGLVKKKTIVPDLEYRRFIAGGLLSLVLLVALSFFTGGGLKGYQGFIHNSRKHLSTPLTNHMGLKTALSASHEYRAEVLKDEQAIDPFATWKTFKIKHFEARKSWYWIINFLYLAILMLAVRNSPLWMTFLLSCTAIPFFTELTCYYYSVFLLLGLTFCKIPQVGIIIPALALGTWSIQRETGWYDVSFELQSILFLVATMLILLSAQWSKDRLIEPNAPEIK